MSKRTITKVLAGVQDVLLGEETRSQIRSGQPVQVQGLAASTIPRTVEGSNSIESALILLESAVLGTASVVCDNKSEKSVTDFERAAEANSLTAVQHAADVQRTTVLTDYASLDMTTPALPQITDSTAITLAELYAEVADMAATLPDLVDDVMGQTAQGRDLHCLRMFDDGERPIILIVCGTHGDEVASVRGWLAALRWVASSTSELAESLRTLCSVYFIPSHNPDGHVNGTRRNSVGENLNRNWPYFWSVAADADKGTAPLSAAECSAVAAYMDVPNRIARVLMCVDTHGWGSRSTWGFLTEQIYNTVGSLNLQRTVLNYANTLMQNSNYVAVNGPVKLLEYRSKRRPYLYTWVVNKGRVDCMGCIIEFPEAESNSLNATVAQDIFVGIAQAAIDHLAVGKLGIVVESGVKPSPVTNNSDLSSWHSTYPRPNWTRYSRLRLSQVYDDLLNRNVCESLRPSEEVLPEPRHGAATAVLLDADGHADLYMIGGVSASYISDVDMYSSANGKVTARPVYPTTQRNAAATTHNGALYCAGGYNGTYLQIVTTHTPGNTGWSPVAQRLVFSGGLQRHALVSWGGLLLIIGGRNAAGYLSDIVALDPATGLQYLLGTMTISKGYAPAEVRGNDLYVFGGWTGSVYLDTVDKLALVDNFVASETDGEIEELNGVSTGDFLSTAYAFSAADVGRMITVQPSFADPSLPVTVGAYEIAAVVDANRVTLATTPAYSAGDNQSLKFVISDPAALATTTTALPVAIREMSASRRGDEVLLHGGIGLNGAVSTLYSYDMATDTVVQEVYELDTWEDEYGNVTQIEEPILYSSHSVYDAIDETLTILGGRDETGTVRDMVYQIADGMCSRIASAAAAYGHIRTSPMYTVAAGEQYTLIATVRNMDPRNDTANPYVRLQARFGTIAAVTRRQRTWYTVPTRDEYYTIVMPIEVRESDGQEMRIYLRHYSADTTIRIANLQLLKGRQALTLPVIDGNLAQDSRRTDFVDVLPTSCGFTLSGMVSPLFAANSSVSSSTLLSFLDTQGAEVLALSFTDVHDQSSNSANSGVYTCTYALTNYSEDVAAFDANYNRSSGKEFRKDRMLWKLIADSSGMTLQLHYCGSVREFDIDTSVSTQLASLVQLNGIHTTPSVSRGLPLLENVTGTAEHTLGNIATRSWTPGPIQANTWHDIAWSPELKIFCAISLSAGTHIATSPDGETWTTRPATGPGVAGSVTWSPELGVFCIVYNTGQTSQFLTSTDGITWILRPGGVVGSWQSIVWSSELRMFCAVSNGVGAHAMSSLDGITWTERAAPVSGWRDVAWSPELGLLCAVSSGGKAMVSPDGHMWTSSNIPQGTWLAITWSPEHGIFCAVALNGADQVATSADGVTWTPKTSASGGWRAIEWSPELGMFCAVALEGAMVSVDGETWGLRALPEANFWRGLSWSPGLGRFCAVAIDGQNRTAVSL